MNNKKSSFLAILLFFIVTLALFLVACEASTVTEVSQATVAADVVFSPEPTVTVQPKSTDMETAVSTIAATQTPVPFTPTPLPTKTSTLMPTETPSPQRYTVEEGDNLTIIADKFDTTAATIQRANKLLDGHAIYIGQELEIPAVAATGGISAEGSAERGILHNRYLCPSTGEIEEMDLEGGTIIGKTAVCQIPIVSHQFGEGETSLLLVGGVHGGYEWNTILLAYEFIDYLRLNPETIPASLSVIIIPNANPDGLFAVTRKVGRFTVDDLDVDTVPGRFNGNFVDLNRNWDCEWTPNAVWRDNPVSGGSAPFSELENQILRDFFLALEPTAVLFFHSAVGAVFASGCGQIDSESERLTAVYSQASGYPQSSGFSQYVITGDASNWLAEQGIPAITIELTTHESLDWHMNLAGVKALIDHLQYRP